MIEDIAGIDAEFQTLGFGQLDGLLQVRIKAPDSRHFQRALSESAASSGKRILENDLIDPRILDRVQGAKRAEVLRRRHPRTLRIRNGLVCAGSEVVGTVG